MLRRRGKGEASFLHCKSPGREETRRHAQRKRDEGGETKERRRRRERWKLRWRKRKCRKEEGRKRGRKEEETRQREVLDESGGRGDTGHWLQF